MHYSSYYKLYFNFIIEINALLANRLRGSDLERAQSIVRLALTELGGGPRRVEQRLRSTLLWCRDPNYRCLMFDSSPQEIAASWMYRDPAHSPCRSATAHHKEHAQRLQFIAHELRLSRTRRKGLVRAATVTAASAARLARENATNRKNQHLRNTGAEYRVDYVKADKRRRRIDLERLTLDYTERLIKLQMAGWIVVFQTIILPEHARPTIGRMRMWGLAGSPDAQDGAKTLRDIQRAALPTKGSSGRLGGFWVLQAHDSNQLHMHSHVAFRSQQEFEAYQQRLKSAYADHTYQYRNFRVVGAFGVGTPVEQNAIDTQVLPHANDIRRSVIYSMREFDQEVNLLPGRRHASFGALIVKKPLSANEAGGPAESTIGGRSEDNRIKHYKALHWSPGNPICVSLVPSTSVASVVFEASHLRPQIRAPPTHCNVFQGCSIRVLCSYSIRHF